MWIQANSTSPRKTKKKKKTKKDKSSDDDNKKENNEDSKNKENNKVSGESVTGKFESVSQAEKAVEKGGIVDSVSDVLDFTLDKVSDMGLLSKNITKVIKSGKDALIDNVSSDIKKEFKTQNKNIENLNKYNNNWKESFEAKDFSSMEKYMKKINNLLNKTLPLENTIKNARKNILF